MKAILYTSRIPATESKTSVPRSLPRILNHARKSNPTDDITGLLTFNNGRYFQVLEGPDSKVDALFQRIKRDTRHENVLLMTEFSITERCFEGNGLKLGNVSGKDQQLLKFVKLHNSELQEMPAAKCHHLEQFFKIKIEQDDDEVVETSAPTKAEIEQEKGGKLKRIGLANSLFRLKKWPAFTNIQPSQAIFTACAQLTKGECGYHQLLKSCGFVNGDELRDFLTQLRAQGILEIREVQNIETIVAPKQSNPSSQSSGFYDKMVRFLSGD